MITIKHLTKTFNHRKVVNDISIKLPRYGLIAICGDSGCGKTTLLNCLSGLLPHEGEIEIDGCSFSSLSEKEKDKYRLKHIGFVFQDFKLFSSETVERNILLPLDISSNMKKDYKERKIKDLLEIVNLSHLNKHKVNNLSGGERQRIAIARALVNDPKIILADEPTGSLDSRNSEEIMRVLEGISKKTLIIVVSHDEELMKRFASRIIHMKDGKISSNEFPNREKVDVYLPIFKNKESNKKPTIPFDFLFRHSLSSMKEKKWRTIICNAVTSLGLMGIGLAISLSSTISANIKNAYSSMIDDSKIIMSTNEEKKIISLSSGNYYDAMMIAHYFPQYVMDVGVNYITDFENFFKSKNQFAIASTTYHEPIELLSARHINEFKWLDYYRPITIYPHKIDYLEDDEIILSLSMPMIEEICLKLRITRTIQSLSEYLENNELLVCLDIANNDWQYYDQQIFTVKGFTLEANPGIYHTNHLWNEYVFENRMRLPSSDELTKKEVYPWIMKKMYYFHTFGNTDEFLIDAEQSPLLDKFILEIGDASYYPWLYRKTDIKDRHRVMFFNNNFDSIPKRYSELLLEENENLIDPIYGSKSGYIFYPSSMLSGFSKQFFFSFNETLLNSVIDSNSSLNLQNNEYTVLEEGVMVGHFSKTTTESVRFAPINEQNVIGNKPSSLDEIVISTELAKALNKNYDVIGLPLYGGYNSEETILENGNLRRTFINTQLRVVGLIESSRYEIYHYPYWTINYFKSRLGISAFDLLINSIAFTAKEGDINTTMKRMSRAFPNYYIVNPMDGINESIGEICSYIEIAMFVFSIVAILVASLLLTICSYLYVVDSQKEIALSRCIGISRKESKKMVIFHTAFNCLVSLLLASFESLIVSIITSLVVSRSMNSDALFTFDVRGIIFMSLMALFISFTSSIWVSNRVGKLNPLEVLKK